MKKNYLIANLFFACLLLFGTKAFAQLSGVVTINNTAPASATNFTSFTAFAAVVNTAGVSGPLTVNVAVGSGPYTEQVNFLQAPGISATNTITINGNGRTITFAAAAAVTPHTILLSGADYMFFNNLNVVGTGTTWALVVHLWNQANNNQFLNCTFTAPNNVTGSLQSPFSISGTSVSPTAAGNCGNNNVANTCTMSGGYYCVSFYGNTAAPFNTGNQILNSNVKDFYFYGVYNAYAQYTTIKGCVIERPTRTTLSTFYGVYGTTGTIDALVEGNHIRSPFQSGITNTGATYGIYMLSAATLTHENIIRNNIISDIYSNGTAYGIYVTAAYNLIYHNTVVLDGATNTAGTTYGIYSTLATSPVKNNIVVIDRAGTGTKYCLYTGTNSGTWNSNHNVFNMLSTAGTNGVVYGGANYTSLAAWQAASSNDLGSTDALPVFNNPLAMDYAPTSTLVNNLCPPLGVMTDFNNNARSPLFPDPGAIEVYTTACVGTPGTNSFLTPTVSFCPGASLDLNLLSSGSYTNAGYTIAWQTATASAVGPFASVPGATLNSYNTGAINQTIYYRAIITCTAGSSYTTTSQSVVVAPVTTSNVPYHESFETLALNELPNCSWTASNMGANNLTYNTPGTNNRVPHSGSNFAAFYSSPSSTSYFYTNGINMIAGITYSASLWYITESGFNNWADLSIMVGTSQSPAGMQTIVSTNGTVTPVLYTSLSNTFTIPSSGLYYVAVKGTPTAGGAPYLSWDDLRITIPCDINGPALSINTSSTTICEGQSVILSGVGANTYSWSTGQTSTIITVSPTYPQSYTLTGFNTLSGCPTSLSQFINVTPSPNVFAAINGTTVGCAGQPVPLIAFGASSYFWNNGSTSANTIVYPTASASYSVIGTNSIGCTKVAVVQVQVNPAPAVSISGSGTNLCKGDQLTLTGIGAATYQWLLGSNTTQSGNPISTSPNASGTYTLVGTSPAGCEGKTSISFAVSECTGLSTLAKAEGLKLYPNPTKGAFVLELTAPANKIEVSDIAGRTILVRSNVIGKTEINIAELANGIYYVRVIGSDYTEVIKVIKNNH